MAVVDGNREGGGCKRWPIVRPPQAEAFRRPNAQPFPQRVYRVVQKTDTQFYFWDNFGNSAPILTIISLLQAEIYRA